MSMKSKHYSINKDRGAHHGKKEHESGSLVAEPMDSSSDTGTRSEHGLSEGNSKHMKSNCGMEYTTQPEAHKLQHVDYDSLTGD